MTLSLESIHQPLTDFFLNLFKTDAGSPVLFRFDKFGSVVSEQDFIQPNHPELGYVPALAMEKFSDLVNHIPADTSDGVNIVLTADSIDTTYFFRLLTPSIPCIPPDLDADTQQSVIQAFSAIKADSVKVWNNVTTESMTGLMLQYKPSLATPENWCDLSKNDVWTSHSFQVTETNSAPAPGPAGVLWKLRLNDEVMRQILQLSEAEKVTIDPQPLNIAARVLELQAKPKVMPTQNMMVEGAKPMSSLAREVQVARLDVAPVAMVDPRVMAAEVQATRLDVAPEATHNINVVTASNLNPNTGVTPAASLALHDSFLQQYSALDVSKRLLVSQYLGTCIPIQPVQTSTISISFDYCVVNIRRPWYVDVFINDKSWCVPAVPKGQVTSTGSAGNLPLVSIGFVAIRNLNIEANWTTEDIANASLATDFGPFKITAEIANNKLSHPGLQIIGWILQKMPDLPPNDAPASVQG